MTTTHPQMQTRIVAGSRAVLRCSVLIALCALTACSAVREAPSTSRVNAPLLAPTLLEGHGLALLTPTTTPEHEEDRQSLALVFAGKFSEMRPEVRIVPLSQTISAVNRAGLTRAYLKMYETFAITGVMDRDTLAKLRGVCGARYFALLQLAEFSRGADNGASALAFPARTDGGSRIRLFLQIWDSTDGTIAWEGVNELTQLPQSGPGSNFSRIVERITSELIARMP